MRVLLVALLAAISYAQTGYGEEEEGETNEVVDICKPGGVAAENDECWDENFTCESCCMTGHSSGSDPKTCWRERHTRSKCCGKARAGGEEEETEKEDEGEGEGEDNNGKEDGSQSEIENENSHEQSAKKQISENDVEEEEEGESEKEKQRDENGGDNQAESEEGNGQESEVEKEDEEDHETEQEEEEHESEQEDEGEEKEEVESEIEKEKKDSATEDARDVQSTELFSIEALSKLQRQSGEEDESEISESRKQESKVEAENWDDAQPDSCKDGDNGEVDQFGDSCDWYNLAQRFCGVFNTDMFYAERMCCSCISYLKKLSKKSSHESSVSKDENEVANLNEAAVSEYRSKLLNWKENGVPPPFQNIGFWNWVNHAKETIADMQSHFAHTFAKLPDTGPPAKTHVGLGERETIPDGLPAEAHPKTYNANFCISGIQVCGICGLAKLQGPCSTNEDCESQRCTEKLENNNGAGESPNTEGCQGICAPSTDKINDFWDKAMVGVIEILSGESANFDSGFLFDLRMCMDSNEIETHNQMYEKMMNLYAVKPWMQTEGMCQSRHFDGIHCWLNQAKSNTFEEGKENLGFADLTIGDSTSIPIQQKCNTVSSLVFYTPALMLCESDKASNLPQEMKHAMQKVFMMHAFNGFFFHATGTELGETLVEATTTLLFALFHEASLSAYRSDDPILRFGRQTSPTHTMIEWVDLLSNSYKDFDPISAELIENSVSSSRLMNTFNADESPYLTLPSAKDFFEAHPLIDQNNPIMPSEKIPSANHFFSRVFKPDTNTRVMIHTGLKTAESDIDDCVNVAGKYHDSEGVVFEMTQHGCEATGQWGTSITISKNILKTSGGLQGSVDSSGAIQWKNGLTDHPLSIESQSCEDHDIAIGEIAVVNNSPITNCETAQKSGVCTEPHFRALCRKSCGICEKDERADTRELSEPESWEEVSKALLHEVGTPENNDPYGGIKFQSFLLIHHAMFLIDSAEREQLIKQLKAENLQSEAVFSERLNSMIHGLDVPTREKIEFGHKLLATYRWKGKFLNKVHKICVTSIEQWMESHTAVMTNPTGGYDLPKRFSRYPGAAKCESSRLTFAEQNMEDAKHLISLSFLTSDMLQLVKAYLQVQVKPETKVRLGDVAFSQSKISRALTYKFSPSPMFTLTCLFMTTLIIFFLCCFRRKKHPPLYQPLPSDNEV